MNAKYEIKYITPIGPLVIVLDIDNMIIISSYFENSKSDNKKRDTKSIIEQSKSKLSNETVVVENLSKEAKNEINKFEKILKEELDNYFVKGVPIDNKKISTYININKLSGTDFQKKVWKKIYDVKYSQGINYTELADKVGAINGARAVGTACGKNPLAIFIPCHRVIRKSNEDYSYSWGKDRKKWLIEHEMLIVNS